MTAAFVDGLDEHLRRDGFKPVAISLPHALAASRLPGPPKIPFDRILIAQAQLEGFAVVTSDPIFQRYRVPVVWWRLATKLPASEFDAQRAKAREYKRPIKLVKVIVGPE